MVARNRLDATRTLTDTRDWAKARRDRTRHLIELGGLILKADLVELLDDDRATLLGALLDVAMQLRDAGDTDPRTPPRTLATGWDARLRSRT